MRSGLYATVGGREYQAEKLPEGAYRIFSDRPEDGWLEENGRWSRIVAREDVERLVSVKAVAVLGASRMDAYPVDGEHCRVVTSNKELAEVLGMEKLGRAEFQKVVPIAKLKSVTETEEQLEA